MNNTRSILYSLVKAYFTSTKCKTVCTVIPVYTVHHFCKMTMYELNITVGFKRMP